MTDSPLCDVPYITSEAQGPAEMHQFRTQYLTDALVWAPNSRPTIDTVQKLNRLETIHLIDELNPSRPVPDKVPAAQNATSQLGKPRREQRDTS